MIPAPAAWKEDERKNLVTDVVKSMGRRAWRTDGLAPTCLAEKCCGSKVCAIPAPLPQNNALGVASDFSMPFPKMVNVVWRLQLAILPSAQFFFGDSGRA